MGVKMVDKALEYASMGLAVMPVKLMGKSPACAHGCKDATTDADEVVELFSKSCNIGIATGKPSGGLFVIDLDVDEDTGKDGTVTAMEWQREHGEFPETAVSLTGGGGVQLLYHTEAPVACSVNCKLGVDIRGEGGYIVAPPSIHSCGVFYEWELGPEEVEVAEADSNVLAFVEFVQAGASGGHSNSGVKRGKRGPVFSDQFRLPSVIHEGERDNTLFRYACSLWSKGLDPDVVAHRVHLQNRVACIPPMSEREVERIVRHVTNDYPRGH